MAEEKFTDDVRCLKLMSGEDVFGRVCKLDNGDLVISQPMVMQHLVDENQDQRYMFLSRFNIYSPDTVTIKGDSVIFESSVIPEVAEHYEASLLYCVEVTDSKFRGGIKEATKSVSQALSSIRHAAEVKEGLALTREQKRKIQLSSIAVTSNSQN